jgi:hypothetical protein
VFEARFSEVTVQVNESRANYHALYVEYLGACPALWWFRVPDAQPRYPTICNQQAAFLVKTLGGVEDATFGDEYLFHAGYLQPQSAFITYGACCIREHTDSRLVFAKRLTGAFTSGRGENSEAE